MKAENSLLTIPKHDETTFLLVQLPDSLPIESLLQTATFVSHNSDSPACLVTEDQSFSMSRVETSNALVLIPPTKDSTLSEVQQPPTKKLMTNQGIALSTTSCHVFGSGSGAFFLELKERHLDLKDLDALLFTFDPYDHNSVCEGKSLDELALALQVSKVQVQDGLRSLQAFEYHSRYCLLSEEAWQEARRSILSALIECDDFGDYAHGGVKREELIRESMRRVAESYPQVDDILRLVVSSMTKKEDGDTIMVDFEKVAIFVAHELFVQPIWTHADLDKEWQARLPGVGDSYRLNMDKLLQGVAIRHSRSEWRYLPCEKLDKNPVIRLRQLFDAREKWTRQELDCYLMPLSTTSAGVDDLLLKHAHSLRENLNGTTITVYASNSHQ